jgi:integrase
MPHGRTTQGIVQGSPGGERNEEPQEPGEQGAQHINYGDDNMRGHIRQRGPRAWAIVLDLGRDAQGKRRQKWHTVHGTKKDAESELVKQLNALHTGTYVEPTRITVAEYLHRWIEDCAKAKVSAKTFERYDEIVRLHLAPAIGHIILTRLQPLHIQGMYSKMLEQGRRDGQGGLSARTVLHHHRVLREALQQAVRWLLLARNPADAVLPPRPEQAEARALDGQEAAQLIERAKPTRLYMPVLLAIATGLRRGEVLALRWKDVDLSSGTATVRQSLEHTKAGNRFKAPKTKKSLRAIQLPAFAITALKQHRAEQAARRLKLGDAYQDHDLIIARPDGLPWNPGSFSAGFVAFARRCGLKGLSYHHLRHTHATLLLGLNVHPKVVSERLGHSHIGLTMDTYSHVMPNMQREAAEMIDAALTGSSKQRREKGD